MTNVLAAKDPDVDREYAIDARAAVIVSVRRNWPYAAGSIGKAPRHTGFYVECTAAGETAYAHPETLGKSWPRAESATLQDGSVVWTGRAPDSTDLPQIQSVEWIVVEGLSVASDRNELGIVYPTVSGGTAGESYELTARITWSTGEVTDVTVVIPVAQQ